MGNFNDILMEKLANHGDGNYYYIDSEEEASRLFDNGATSLLQVIGSDAKIQAEFNPASIDRFRLLGYENRRLETIDFENDSVDAGEVGAGQTVTALYEIRIKDGAPRNSKAADVRIRYANVDTGEAEETERSVTVRELKTPFADASSRFRFTAAVAEFAEILKESYWARNGSLDSVLEIAENSASDLYEKDAEFLKIVEKTKNIKLTLDGRTI